MHLKASCTLYVCIVPLAGFIWGIEFRCLQGEPRTNGGTGPCGSIFEFRVKFHYGQFVGSYEQTQQGNRNMTLKGTIRKRRREIPPAFSEQRRTRQCSAFLTIFRLYVPKQRPPGSLFSHYLPSIMITELTQNGPQLLSGIITVRSEEWIARPKC